MKQSGKKHSPAFKAKVVLVAIQEENRSLKHYLAEKEPDKRTN